MVSERDPRRVGKGRRRAETGQVSASSTLPSRAAGTFVPTLPTRAAAYTRTGVLQRFLAQAGDALPQRVDNEYAESRLRLKGGDVRAFLQSVRVLGLVDPYGRPTERLRQARAASQRPHLLRQALEEAYPDLVRRWERHGGMSREALTEYFKVEYGLSASSAAPAAKLFEDLMQQAVRATDGEQRAARVGRPGSSAATPQPGPPVVDAWPAAPPDPDHPPSPFARAPVRAEEPEAGAAMPAASPERDPRLAALEAVRSTLHVTINEQWDEARIRLVFECMQQLVDSILAAPARRDAPVSGRQPRSPDSA